MFCVETAVAVQGSLIASGVIVQSPSAAVRIVHSPPSVTKTISKFCALAMLEVKDDLVHDEVAPPPNELVNPKLGESSVCSEPTTPQLDAEDTDGIANAHNAIALAKSNTPFFENFFMATLLVSLDRRRDEWFGPLALAYVSDALREPSNSRSRRGWCHAVNGHIRSSRS